MRRTPDSRATYHPNPTQQRRRKKAGATGLGFRLNVTVCPKFDQISLAFSTLLLFLSLDLFVLTVLKSVPGILSSKFTPTQCRVVQKSYTNYTHCYVSTLNYHLGEKRGFPCLQVHVRLASDNTSLASPLPTSASMTETIMTSENDPNLLLLYQNELQIAGDDYRRKPCSYMPEHCSHDALVIRKEVYEYSKDIGPVNSTIDCHYLADPTGLAVTTNGMAMRFRVVTAAQVINSIMWPIVGVVVSVTCCLLFWKKNHHRTHRLFIYNAWSPS